MSIKISIIGAGSGAFSLSLIRDLCLIQNLHGCTVSFMDINPERLEGSYGLCRRYAAELGAGITLEKTLDRAESLDGADFVINTALAAGHQHLRAGWEIARGLGYRIGGSLAVMHDEAFWVNFHQLRLFESVVEDVLRLCPNALYMQVANPVLAATTYLPRKYPALRMIGLCHGFGGVYHVAKLALGGEFDHDGLTFELPGVNHFLWLTRLYYQGEDLLPRFAEWVEQRSPDYFAMCGKSDHMGPKPVDIYRRMGVVPIGDTATPGGGTWGWQYHVDEAAEQRWQEDPETWYQGYFGWVEQVASESLAITQDETRRVTEYLEPRMSGEQMAPIIESIVCDLPRTYIVNTPNTGGYVPGVPANFAVEVPALVSKRGVQPIQTGGLPPAPLAALLRDRVAPVELELAAYQQGSRRLLEELIALDPWSRSLEQARALVQAILAMEGNEAMDAHYQ